MQMCTEVTIIGISFENVSNLKIDDKITRSLMSDSVNAFIRCSSFLSILTIVWTGLFFRMKMTWSTAYAGEISRIKAKNVVLVPRFSKQFASDFTEGKLEKYMDRLTGVERCESAWSVGSLVDTHLSLTGNILHNPCLTYM